MTVMVVAVVVAVAVWWRCGGGDHQVMGGECNYLHRVKVTNGRIGLEVVPPKLWKDGRGVRWSDEQIAVLLDTAEVCVGG